MGKKTKMRKKTESIVNGEIAYRDCVVTFIDILGFKNIIAKRSPAEIQEIVGLVQRHTSSGDKESAKEYASDFNDDMPWTRSIFFSDSVVRIRPYDGEFYEGSLFYEFLDLVHAQAELVNRGIFIRGGITVGKLYHRDDVLFGPAMVQAYELESRFANYPRIVVDPAALAALKADERLRNEDNDLEENLAYVRKLLLLGEDGLHYIDYLGAFREEMDDYGAFPDFLARVKDHIITNAVASKENLGVLQKFLWLARYLNTTAKRFCDCRDDKHLEIAEGDIASLISLQKNTSSRT